MINSNEYEKVEFSDYERFFYLYPTATDRLWSEHKRFYFYNVNADAIGSEVWFRGKKRAPTLSNASDLLPFSPTTDNQENSGNYAIVEIAFASALGSEKLNNYGQAAIELKEALAILDAAWAPIAARRSAAQSKDRPFFEAPDFFPPRNRGRGSTNIGNFP